MWGKARDLMGKDSGRGRQGVERKMKENGGTILQLEEISVNREERRKRRESGNGRLKVKVIKKGKGEMERNGILEGKEREREMNG